MVDLKKYRGPILSIVIIFAVLAVMIAIGFTIGILSEDPDGLERVLIDVRGEEWVEGLSSPWDPIFGWIGNDYIVALIGISLTVIFIVAFFALISFLAKQKRASE